VAPRDAVDRLHGPRVRVRRDVYGRGQPDLGEINQPALVLAQAQARFIDTVMGRARGRAVSRTDRFRHREYRVLREFGAIRRAAKR
jgi:hypothetical protein